MPLRPLTKPQRVFKGHYFFVVSLYLLIGDLFNPNLEWRTFMRRTASEVIRELEARIARLERQSHTMSKKDRARLDELQILEDQDRLTRSQNAEYEALVKEYRLTDEYKSKQKRASSDVLRAGQKVLKARAF
jgi:hypothetical protein